jgi:hypothetical protein
VARVARGDFYSETFGSMKMIRYRTHAIPGEEFQELEPQTKLLSSLVTAFDIDDYCPLCDCHPSSGHSRQCPIVEEAIDKVLEKAFPLK